MPLPPRPTPSEEHSQFSPTHNFFSPCVTLVRLARPTTTLDVEQNPSQMHGTFLSSALSQRPHQCLISRPYARLCCTGISGLVLVGSAKTSEHFGMSSCASDSFPRSVACMKAYSSRKSNPVRALDRTVESLAEDTSALLCVGERAARQPQGSGSGRDTDHAQNGMDQTRVLPFRRTSKPGTNVGKHEVR